MEDRKQNQGQGGAARQPSQDEAYQKFQGGGRTGTPVRPQSSAPSGQRSGQTQGTQERASSTEPSSSKDNEGRRGADWDASRGQSGKTAAGEDTRPL